MNYQFAAIQPDYEACFSRMQITRVAAVNSTADRLVGFIDAGRYDAGCKTTGVSVAWAAASFEREASSNFNLNPAQGWPLNQKSKDIPYNGPFSNWTDAQVAAYQIDALDKVGVAGWTWARAAYEGEAFNGFGYRAHGIHSPYLFAGTNIYVEGKYVADGDWSPTTVDTQLGIVPMMMRIIQLRPQLALADTLPLLSVPAPALVPAPAPAPLEVSPHNVIALHGALNKLLALQPPFPANDDNYDNDTRYAVRLFQQKAGFTGDDVDGIAGPQTWDAITKAVAA